MRDDIVAFLRHAHAQGLRLYNENTFQMELGIYLRQRHPEKIVCLERPITDFGRREPSTKKEIDIAVLHGDETPLVAIELKMPQSGRVPESMFDFCKDIQFCEVLVRIGFQTAFAVIRTDDRDFWQGRITSGIYQHFRSMVPISGRITKPTGEGKGAVAVEIIGSYPVHWQADILPSRFAIVQIRRDEIQSTRSPHE